jgi:hypothetical protein
MADNQFSVRVPSALEGLMGAQQGYDQVSGMMKQRQVSAAREQAAQEIMQGGNPQNALARLISVGDMQGAAMLSNMSNNNRDFQFRQQESQRQQGNADRQFTQHATDAQRTQANADRNYAWTVEQGSRPEIRTEEDEMGRKVDYLIDRKAMTKTPISMLTNGTPSPSGPPVPMQAGGASPAAPGAASPANISALPFKPTDSEKTDLSKATISYRVLDKELESYGNLIKEGGVSIVPGTVERARYDTARRNIQLQMKELYNLGVLNGPDLGLMNQMLVDPTVGIRQDATKTQALYDAASAPMRHSRCRGRLART